MPPAKYLRHLPAPLLSDLVEQRWLPIVGSGLSRNAITPQGTSMPLWGDLGQAVAAEMADFPYTGPLDALSAYAHEYSRARLVENLSRSLLVGRAEPGAAHRAFCSIPFDIVCTTNIEFLLEDGYRTLGRYCRPLIDEDQLSVSGKDVAVNLLKLHGDLHHPQRLVITEEDYDGFLTRYPLMATYLANLLITRSAVLIGYSADDPDFRQVWQLIGDRLGPLRRTAYTLMVNPQPTEVARFARRGVKVIALPGARSRYGQILAGLFDELRAYQTDKVVPASQVTEEEQLAELALPREAANRLCLLAVPISSLPFYKDRVFELVRRHQFVPITSDDVLEPGDAVAPKVQGLIERARLVIADVSRPWIEFELRLAVQGLGRDRVLAIVQENLAVPSGLEGLTVIRRPSLPMAEPGPLLTEIDQWLAARAATLAPQLINEPERLLRLREYRAAVVAGMTLLEATLRNQLGEDRERHGPSASISRLIDSAEAAGLVSAEEAQRIEEWRRLRNAVVHSAVGVTAKTARGVVAEILRLVRRLRNARGGHE